MTKCFRVIAYTPYNGEEFVGYCCYNGENPLEVERAKGFADILVAENAEEHIRDHIKDLTDEEALEEYYGGCGARWEEIDYNVYKEEAFEDYEGEEGWV